MPHSRSSRRRREKKLLREYSGNGSKDTTNTTEEADTVDVTKFKSDKEDVTLSDTAKNTTPGGKGGAARATNISIISRNTQIGNQNVIRDNSEQENDSETEDSATGGFMMTKEAHKFSMEGNGTNVFMTKNLQMVLPNSDRLENDGKSRQHDVQAFLDLVDNFRNGHYILVVDKVNGDCYTSNLSLVDWIAVFDFDQQSRYNGLLSYVEKHISKRRSLTPTSWQEEKCTYTDNSLYWCHVKGCSFQPETLTEDDFQKWKRQTKSKLLQHLKQLKKFGDHTDFTVVVIWSKETENYKHIHFLVNEISDCLSPRDVVIADDGSAKSDEAKHVFSLLRDDFKVVTLGLTDVCKIVASVCASVTDKVSSDYHLPTSDASQDPEIDEERAQWLKKDLDVLYLNNTTGTEYSASDLSVEEDNFFKGGTLPWSWWYEVGPGRVDIERDILKDIVNFIKTRHIGSCKSGCITLFHNPGSGGTTLAQRVLWTLKDDIPSVQVKQRSHSNIKEIAEKIDFLSDKSRLPVLVLVDGGDEQKVKSIQSILTRCCVIILYVKRYREKIDSDTTNMKRGVFKLKSRVSIKEAENLKHLCIRQCHDQRQKRNIDDLVIDIKKDKSHSLFDFGFAIHSYKYKGIVSYVQGYLKSDKGENGELQVWQKALAYLSLVHYYGQASLPFKVLSRLMSEDSTKAVTRFDEFPDEMKELMVRDVQDRRTHIRVSHYFIAVEILNQLLIYPMIISHTFEQCLTKESKTRLGKGFAVEFIRKAGEINQGEQSTTMSHIMTRTFILRDNKAVGENETQVTKSKQKFSKILEDVSSTHPYTERFDIYQTLTECFPSEAQFHAHLGRLYTHCRPEEIDLAEKCFQEAVDIGEAEILGKADEDIPYNSKLDLMHIYHMYGNMILNRIGDYTGKYLGDVPKKQSDLPFTETATQLLQNVKRASDLFSKCRDMTLPGCEESFGYIGEIQVRLMFCDYVNRNCGVDLCQYAEENESDIARFVKECVVTVDELFLLCFSSIEPEKMDRNVSNCQQWYAALFNHIPGKYIHRQKDDAMSRRLEIAKVKMKYCKDKSYGILERVDNVRDVEFIVGELEKNFIDYQNKVPDTNISKRAMDLDYREWLYAIRHNKIEGNYSIERVLQQVQTWHELLQTPHSWYYLFVLKSLLGFGSNESPGNSALLRNALVCKDEMLIRSKHVTKPKYPREWLGQPENSIRRLVSGRRFFGQVEGRDIKGIDFETLEIQKGTICAPNDRPARGYIDLDLGPKNKVSVKVFFIPARSENNLKGPSYEHTRVEFVIGFSLLHGYEAFNVKLLKHQNCTQCQVSVEKRSCDKAVQCPRCQKVIKCTDSNKCQTKSHDRHHKANAINVSKTLPDY